ncbi:MAG: zinc metallopeptidase [Saccharospirillaceae bacterium]|nr:zinc metallopeptidase [Pseudomonadales bacterium]NRB80571.1 zinc metallopeptidase [Saccharospirillaceae bacterium]
MPFVILLVLVVLLLSSLPTLWIKFQLNRYSKHREDIQGTGGELAQHLVEKLKLDDVEVLPGDSDYYSATEKAVYLSAPIYNGKSIAAVAVAVHEIGHALQHKNNDRLFSLRQTLAPTALIFQKMAILIIYLMPFVTFLVKSPIAILFFAMVAIGCFLIAVLFHLITLPLEFDASFNKALPIIEKCEFLNESDMPGARKVLKAAALTYVASSLLKMINVYTWWRVLKR